MKIPSSKNTSCPIITFYSYKGGIGRTTALAAFAAFYARHYGKRIMMIDCDFEAPGFDNYFELSHAQSNGVVEYLLDKQFAGDKIKLKPYVLEVPKKYSGKGEIHVIFAGNLRDEIAIPDAPKSGTHFRHYLEGLSRLNISGHDQMFDQFSNFFDEIHREIKPDVILIDTRNGINDIFANIGLPMSTIVVGFFANDFQSIPGLKFFLRIAMKSEFATILVNSLVPNEAVFEDFKQLVNRYLQKEFPKKPSNLKMTSIEKDARLECLGTQGDDQALINDPSSYKSFFEVMIAQLMRRG